MKISIITCHNVYNYGASLQAYALHRFLQKLNHDVEIIDFRPDFLNCRYNLAFVPRQSKYYGLTNRYPILKWGYGLMKNMWMLKTYGRKCHFDRFANEYLRLSDHKYATTEALRQNPPKSDVYIAGSDQIWNTSVENGRTGAFYLDFGGDNVRRMSYAASFGVSEVAEQYLEFVKDQLSKFDVISVREHTGKRILAELGYDSARVVLDPVFLLSASDWHDLSLKSAIDNPTKEEPYILVYDFLGDERISQFVRKLSEAKKMPIVSVNDFRQQPYADINISNAGPLEFLYLLENAAYVVSNSFHATAFSVIFGKEFYVFSMKEHANSSRMTDFLNIIGGLLQRFNPDAPRSEKLDYEQITGSLSPLIDGSVNFLKRTLKSFES